MLTIKFGKKIFGQFYVKFGHFSGKNHVKLGNFVHFSGNVIIIRYFDNFSGKNHAKFGQFVNFLYIFSGKNVVPPLS